MVIPDRFTNIGRYLNHSIDGNCKIIRRLDPFDDQPVLIGYSICNINVRERIRYNYNGSIEKGYPTDSFTWYPKLFDRERKLRSGFFILSFFSIFKILFSSYAAFSWLVRLSCLSCSQQNFLELKNISSKFGPFGPSHPSRISQ